MVGVRRPRRAASNVRHSLKRGAAKFIELGRDRSGTVVLLAGFMFPVLVGGMGLGAEAGLWYFTQRKLQHAADVSAYASGVTKFQNPEDETRFKEAAVHIAQEAGWDQGRGTIEVNWPPQAPSQFVGDDDYLQVVLTESMPRLFSSLFTGEPLTLTGRAVVRVVNNSGNDGCVLALHATASAAVSLSGGASVQLSGCDVSSNSSAANAFNMSGSSQLTTGCVHSVGGASPNQNLTLTDAHAGQGPCKNGKPNEYSSRVADPYATVAEPPEMGNCENRTFHPNQTRNLQPYQQGHPSGLPVYRFCGSVSFQGIVNFAPGLYIFSCNQGGNCNNVSVTANAGAVLNGVTPPGVTFYLAPGVNLNFNGNATINLAARSEDPYAGILFFSSRQGPVANHTVNGGAGGSLTGAVYFANGNIQYAGGANVGGGGCTQVIGRTVEFTGNSRVGSDCTGRGTRRIVLNDTIVQLIE